jgi:hypothetical protein
MLQIACSLLTTLEVRHRSIYQAYRLDLLNSVDEERTDVLSGIEACRTPYINMLIHEMNDDSTIARATFVYRACVLHIELAFVETLCISR